MDINIWIIISIVLAAAVIVLGAMLFTQRRRSGQLQQRFGPEYERTVNRYGSQKDAEEELIERERRVKRFQIVPLSREDAARFSEDWRGVQNRFVDDPKAAVEDGDRQVRALMQRRGYPMEAGLYDPPVVAMRVNSDIIRWNQQGNRTIKTKIPAAPGDKYVGLVMSTVPDCCQARISGFTKPNWQAAR